MPRQKSSDTNAKRRTSKECLIPTSVFVVSIQRGRFYAHWRHYWTICSIRKPEELVCWGFAATRELAELESAKALAALQR